MEKYFAFITNGKFIIDILAYLDAESKTVAKQCRICFLKLAEILIFLSHLILHISQPLHWGRVLRPLHSPLRGQLVPQRVDLLPPPELTYIRLHITHSMFTLFSSHGSPALVSKHQAAGFFSVGP